MVKRKWLIQQRTLGRNGEDPRRKVKWGALKAEKGPVSKAGPGHVCQTLLRVKDENSPWIWQFEAHECSGQNWRNRRVNGSLLRCTV